MATQQICFVQGEAQRELCETDSSENVCTPSFYVASAFCDHLNAWFTRGGTLPCVSGCQCAVVQDAPRGEARAPSVKYTSACVVAETIVAKGPLVVHQHISQILEVLGIISFL